MRPFVATAVKKCVLRVSLFAAAHFAAAQSAAASEAVMPAAVPVAAQSMPGAVHAATSGVTPEEATRTLAPGNPVATDHSSKNATSAANEDAVSANADAANQPVAKASAVKTDTGKSDEGKLRVSAAYLELTAGPGRGYPALHALEQGQAVEVIKRKTDWFLLRAANGTSGWASRDTVLASLKGAGYVSPTLDDYGARRVEIGMTSGDFGGAATIGLFGAVALSPNVALKVSGQRILGKFSDGWVASGDVVMQPFADWRLAPYFTLGGGRVSSQPQTTLIASQDRLDDMAHVGVGLRLYLARRFVMRVEYERYEIFTSRSKNQEIRQWQAGFSAFF